ncbi:MAG: transposase, partial [Bacteroidia bacterium]
MGKSLFQIWIHAVWTVKQRAPVLDKSFRFELFRHIKTIASEKGIYVDIINGIEDHVHCLFLLKSTQTVANVLKELKGESSRWINENNLIGGEFAWQAGYG